jgi:site-specific DNA-cytosine methylase
MEKLIAIDMFSGSGGVKAEFQDCGFDCLSVDIEKKFNPDICIDICNLRRSILPRSVDVVWMSPPCTTYSVLSIGHHWDTIPIGYRNYFHSPRSADALQAIKILRSALRLLVKINPKYYFIENPRGGMRHSGELVLVPFRAEIEYGHYGAEIAKPTDIFHNCTLWQPEKKPRCVGMKGLKELPNAYERSKVPGLLVREIAEAAKAGLLV